MSEITQTPITFNCNANLIPVELNELNDTTPFSGSNCNLSILSERTIDGYSLKRLQVVPSW